MPGDLLMMDNHRLLHGRTSYDANEGGYLFAFLLL